MAFWKSQVMHSVKVAVQSGDASELRRVKVAEDSTVEAFLKQVEVVVQAQLERHITYMDQDGDRMTLTTDAEFCDALRSGITSFEVTVDRQVDALTSWEVVGGVTEDLETDLEPTPDGIAEDLETDPDPISWSDTLHFWLNGELQTLKRPSPGMFLVDWLREVKGLTGTKIGCHQGGCGICTVAMTFVEKDGHCQTVSINSCLRLVCGLDGVHITTTEGIGSQSDGFHPVQKAIADGNGSQCGYCTPGWVMQMYSLLQTKAEPSKEEIERHFDGNLCRCTGYRPILSAFGEFAPGGKCCSAHHLAAQPAGLLAHTAKPLHFVDLDTGFEWYRPLTMQQFSAARKAAKAAGKTFQPLCANTASAFGGPWSVTVFADITHLQELQGIKFDASTGLVLGATTTIEQTIQALDGNATQMPHFGTIADHLKRVASNQVRNVGTWAGNLMMTRGYQAFPSDIALALATAGAQVSVVVGAETKALTVPELFALDATDVLVLNATIPPLPEGTLLRTYKTGRRAALAQAVVNLGVCVTLGDGKKVAAARVLVSGVSATLLDCSETARCLVGSTLDQASFSKACTALQREIATSPSTDERDSQPYREQLALSFLYKAFLAAQDSLPEKFQSSQVEFVPFYARPISSGDVDYEVEKKNLPLSDWVPKLTSIVQASGEAEYTSDVGKGALFAQAVFSSAARAKLLSLDPTEALSMPGVVDFISAAQVPGKNCIGGEVGGDNDNDKLFWEIGDEVPCVGVMLGLIVADTWQNARQAAQAVVQKYSEKREVVKTIKDAKRLNRVLAPAMKQSDTRRRHVPKLDRPGHLTYQDTSVAPAATRALAGKVCTGGQNHFYMETQATVVTPVDGNRYEVLLGDQDPNHTAIALGQILGVPMHNVNVKVRRVGGAFGGKLLRQVPLAGACAVAAKKLKAPIRAQNDRGDDMQMNTGRQPIDFNYDVTFDDTGKVQTMDLKLDFSPGWYHGDCQGDLDMAIGFSDNCYKYSSFNVSSTISRTDTVHGTSQRAPGVLQSTVAAEAVMEHVARTLGKRTEEIQELNFYKIGDATPFGDEIGRDGYNWTIPTIWKDLQKSAEYESRRAAVETYNGKNRWTKKGIAISPIKYVMGTSFYSSGAHIAVYGDGTVLVSHGGCEIGQGIDTKAILAAANVLDLPVEKITAGPTETSKIPNNTCTGGSGTSECTAAAVIKACETIKDRLSPYRKKGMKWEEAITQANIDGVSLMASGWFKQADTANANTYSTYGVGISEITIDVLTGEIRLERIDVQMDLGTQLDAAVDVGQLQGGLVMALGYSLTEELKVDASGTQLFLQAWDYKIPGAYDIPVEFNVSLLKGTPNPAGIKGSKASAEPSMGLVSSTYLAVKSAIYAAREDNGLGKDHFQLNLPMTTERIQMATGVTQASLVFS